MKKILLTSFILLLLSSTVHAQNTNVSATVTDAGGQAWNNGTYTFNFVPAPRFNGTYQLNGSPYTPTSISGTLSSSASLTSIAVPNNALITPSGTQWSVTVCPQGSGSCFISLPITITGASQTITSSLIPPAIVVSCGNGVTAYADTEVQCGIGGQYYNLTTQATRICQASSGNTCSTWTSSSGGGGANVPSTSYTLFTNGTNITATSNGSGSLVSGTDLSSVWTTLTSATPGGRILLKNGVFPVLSMTNESATGCNNFDGSSTQLAYALPFPSNTFANSVQWIVEGESTSVWQGEVGSTTVNNSGVVINVTPTAVSSVTAGTILAGFWQRPATNCTLQAFGPTNVSNHVMFHNLTLRFPNATRGNECAFCMYFTTDLSYDNVVADKNVSYNTLKTGSAPTVGTWNDIGLTSTVSGSGNWEDFRHAYATGYNLAYDFQSEHITGTTITAIYNNIACEFGRSATAVFHPVKIDHFVDQENGAGCIWGPQVTQGSAFDIFFDFELGGTADTNWYSTARAQQAKLSETNTGYGTGILRYQVVVTPGGIVSEIPSTTLFTSGGQNFQGLEATNPPNLALVPIVDNMTRPNAGNIGPAWVKLSFSAQLSLASNAATNAGTGLAYAPYVAQPFTSAQFSRITIGAINTNSGTFAEAQTNVLTSAQTYYTGFCSGAAAGGIGIIKVTAGSSSTLTSQTSTACVATDTIELRSIPFGGNVVLYLYRNGVLVTGTNNGNPFTDSSSPLSGGSPGIAVVTNVGSAASISKAEVGNLPTFHNGDTQFSNESYTLKLNTIGNCNPGSSVSPAACGSASSGTVVVPTTTTSYTVNTTVVTTNSRIILLPITDNSGLTGAPTCNAPPTPFIAYVSGRTAGTSFTFTLPSTTGASCWTYNIVD